MDWRQVDDGRWRLADPDFSGTALLKETNSGYIASITVEESRFEMELLDERDFFPKKEDALAFLRDHMDRDSY